MTSSNTSNDICGQPTVWAADVADEQTATERMKNSCTIHINSQVALEVAKNTCKTTFSHLNSKQISYGPQLQQIVSRYLRSMNSQLQIENAHKNHSSICVKNYVCN